MIAARFATVEPVFGNLRHNKRLSRFTLRGKAKVDGQWKLEGVGPLLLKRGVKLLGKEVESDRFAQQIATRLQKSYLYDSRGRPVTTFINRPRHHIRAIPPNAADRSYCERLGALAVESGLAGYTGCMVSWWLNEYVLVPLCLAATKRSLATGGLFWKQVVLSTGQPDIMPDGD